MNRNIAKPFTATLSLLDVATDKTHKYKCFHGEDVQLTVNVVGENNKPIDLSNTSVKIYFTLDKNVNEPIYRQDTGIVVDNLGIITVMLEKSYIRIGNNVLKIVLYDEDQTVFLQPLIISCIDPLIGEVADLEIPDDIDVRDELYDIRRIIGDLQDFDDDLGREIIEVRNEYETVGRRLDNFDSQLEENTLELNNYTTTTYKRYSQAMFSFTDDDGDTDLLTTIMPLSKELNIPFTIYTWYNSPIFSNYSDMQNMYWNYGWEFGYHTTGKITEQTDEVIHKAIIEFKDKMSELGFNVDTFAYGYGSFDNRTVGIAKQYFNVALGTVMEDKYYSLGLMNNTSDMYRSKRVYISSWTPIEDYKKLVDEALKNNCWIVFFQHSREITEKLFILDKLKQLIQYIQEKGGRIETVSNAYKILNNKKLYEVDSYYQPYVYKNFIENPTFSTNEDGTSINVWNRTNKSKITSNSNVLTFSESGQSTNTLLKIFQNVNIPKTNEKFCFSIESYSDDISAIDGNYDGQAAFVQITVYNEDNTIVKTYRKNIKPLCNGVWCKNNIVLNRMRTTTSKVEISIILSKNGILKVKNPKFEIGDKVTIDI